ALYFTPKSTNEVIRFINKLKTCISRGIDGVSNHVVKVIYTNVAPPFTIIVNLSIETGVFPEQLKTAVVIPVHKKRSYLSGITQIMKNYDSFSDNVQITGGVPKGTPQLLSLRTYIIFDYTSLCYTARSTDDLFQMMQTDIDRLYLSFSVNKMVLSP
ncbi:hypothetical protein J437_LFUL012047, partial [Ladona fulva]